MTGATRRDRGKLGGLKRNGLIRKLALGGQSQADLARQYDVTDGAITQFRDRNAEAIAAIRADAEDEFAGILIAQKAERLRAYEELYEVATEPTPKISPSGKLVKEWIMDEDGVSSEVVVHEVDVRAAAQVLKQAAEEMGQLPTRLQVAGELGVTTTYRVEGVNPSDLQ